MKRTHFDDKRDEAIADRSADPVDVVGRCSAHGCPNIWTRKEAKLCRWHSAAAPRDWPAVTEELQRMVTDAAYARQGVEPAPALTREDKAAVLEQMRGLFTTREPANPKAWAYALKDREESGERLSSAQRTMWRDALQWLRVEAAKREEPETAPPKPPRTHRAPAFQEAP